MMPRTVACALTGLACFVGCSKSPAPEKVAPADQPIAASAATTPPAPPPLPPPPAPPAPKTKVELAIEAGANGMAFNKTALSVPTGAEVHLVFTNNKPGSLAHNWALVRPGTEASVAAAGLAKGPNENYAAPGPDLLAFTPLAQPGTSVEISFTAPPPGAYPYICTFPGHYMMMKGVLTVN